jgi:mannose PTS system EIIA component
MIGLILVTHGNLATEFIEVLEHVVGKQDHILTVCIYPKDDLEQKRKDLLRKIQKVDQGHGVIILTDMFGGTPSNLAISVMNSNSIEVLAGINLPMLVKLASVRKKKTLIDAVILAQDAGKKYIHQASNLLKSA